MTDKQEKLPMNMPFTQTIIIREARSEQEVNQVLGTCEKEGLGLMNIKTEYDEENSIFVYSLVFQRIPESPKKEAAKIVALPSTKTPA